MAVLLPASLVVLPSGRAGAADEAPGAPGARPAWTPADKTGYGTSRTLGSKVWFTLRDGALSEVYYPDLGTPSVREMRFVVSDGTGFTEREGEATRGSTTLVDGRALVYRQTNTARSGKWRLTKTYVTDPARASVLVDVTFESLTGRPYRLYALHNPRLSNGGVRDLDDRGETRGGALVAEDGRTAGALASSPAFAETSSGYQGVSDGWTDLRADHTMNWHYEARSGGNVVQTGRIPVTGLRGGRKATLALGFGADGDAALATARATLGTGWPKVSAAYARGWHDYVASLKRPPASAARGRNRAVYDSSVMVLAAHEDKANRGAFIASPSMPWAWGTNPELEDPSGAYHLVWARDIVHKATGLLAAGDRAAADRALTWLFRRQQKPDGSFPQNSTVEGREHWTNVQMDEVAAPIILAWSLRRTGGDDWSHVRRAADYIVAHGPVTRQERWENQGGYSPATIAAEIAGLVCAADIAAANGDRAARRRYLETADEWRSKVKSWTATPNGPYGPRPYFVRITKDGRPDLGTRYDIGDSGPAGVDQRAVVDPSHLELVRLGVLPAGDPVIRNTNAVVDARLSELTPAGRHWHRYDFDGYGERRDGGEWNVGHPPGSRTTIGRLWPLFAGERGEYEVAAGLDARRRLADMAATGTESGILPEQVWDGTGPGRPGTPTYSAAPLGWAHGQFIRLAWSIEAGRSLSTPAVVACRYLRTSCR
ncbi:glucoamylase [Bailinhaonella thermotolerans]|uniref:Glucoamylase n=2 Tax=Bailinhaonella thermotolerans TaxID=1070861 RepID=A0A3A4A844_9ACTN|nr:glucoamylase [Bailinhaonella thermotolerans]